MNAPLDVETHRALYAHASRVLSALETARAELCAQMVALERQIEAAKEALAIEAEDLALAIEADKAAGRGAA